MKQQIKGKSKKAKTNQPKQTDYFGKQTDQSIVLFQDEQNLEKKQKIFEELIQPSFAKLIENLIFVYKFHILGDLDALKNDCMSFLFETIDKWDRSRGFKAFSYFNLVAKHWFIQRVKNYKKKNKLDIYFDKNVIDKIEKEDFSNKNASIEESIITSEFYEFLKEEVKNWRDKYHKKQEKLVLESVILILENPDLISLHNKKAIFLYLREITRSLHKANSY